MYLVGHRRNSRSNQDTQASIESYHVALKRWMKIDNHQLRGQRMDFSVWRLTTPVIIHYMYNHRRKLNVFVFSKWVEKIVTIDIIKIQNNMLEHIRHQKAHMGG